MSNLDNYTEQEISEIVKNSQSMRGLCKALGYKSNGSNHQTVYKYLKAHNISTNHFTHRAADAIVRSEDNVFIEDSTASQKVLRTWYLKGNYTEYKCAICGQPPEWNNKPLVLTLDHINGDNHDNRLTNLRWVCPNCDRQLPTYAGKNIHKQNVSKNQVNKCVDCGALITSKAIRCVKCSNKNKSSEINIDIEQLQNQLIAAKGNFSKVGRLYGVSDNAIRKRCKKYNLPSHSKDYK